ncbi:MAG: FHA domain-containing protein [Deltaproteobacteria bacterium]|nr:MAG: FHA domain-containing protein [Deltaproteobacteria bacterium]
MNGGLVHRRIWSLEDLPVVVGRAPGVGLRVPDPGVSARHLEIGVIEEGGVQVVHLRSGRVLGVLRPPAPGDPASVVRAPITDATCVVAQLLDAGAGEDGVLSDLRAAVGAALAERAADGSAVGGAGDDACGVEAHSGEGVSREGGSGERGDVVRVDGCADGAGASAEEAVSRDGSRGDGDGAQEQGAGIAWLRWAALLFGAGALAAVAAVLWWLLSGPA